MMGLPEGYSISEQPGMPGGVALYHKGRFIDRCADDEVAADLAWEREEQEQEQIDRGMDAGY